MKIFKSTVLLSIFCVAVIVMNAITVCASAIFSFETQYDYSEANPAWLTDLTVKEDMLTVSGMVREVSLTAEPDYPYTETAESFAADVRQKCAVYSITEDTPRTAYLYVFDVMNHNSSVLEDGTSDAEIKDYLTANGIVYPDDADSDTLIMARALYVVMKNGSLDAVLENGKIPSGTQLETAVVTYMSSITGTDMDAITEWIAPTDSLSLDEYILAAAKYALWADGYDVSIDTDEKEVYRLVALMTIREYGLSADESLSFDELKMRYMGALLDKSYSVHCSESELRAAYLSDTVPYYILQLMAQQDAALSIRPDFYTYEQAFDIVAENTDRFDMEYGEFYADVYHYSAVLQYCRSSIWIYPVSYHCYDSSNTGNMVTITANGETIADGTFNEISLDTTKEKQTIEIAVHYAYGSKKSDTVYYLTITQGIVTSDSVLIPTQTISDIISGNTVTDSNLYAEGYVPNTSSVVGDILDSMGLGISMDEFLSASKTALTAGTSSFSGLQVLSPSIDTDFSLLDSIKLPQSETENGNYSAILGSLLQQGTDISVSDSTLQLTSVLPETLKTTRVQSGIGGLELFSVAESFPISLSEKTQVSDNGQTKSDTQTEGIVATAEPATEKKNNSTASSVPSPDLSAVGDGIESAASGIGGVLTAGIGAAVQAVVPVAGTMLHAAIFDDGTTDGTVTVTLDNDINANLSGTNLAYLSLNTQQAAVRCASGSGDSGVQTLDLSDYMSQQQVNDDDTKSAQNIPATVSTAGTENGSDSIFVVVMGITLSAGAVVAAVIICRKKRL